MKKKNLKKYDKMKKKESKDINLDLTRTVSDLKKTTDDDSDSDSDIFLKEARSSIEVASQLINSIMNGRQIDVAYFKHMAAYKQDRVRFLKKYAANKKKRKE